MKIVQVVGARPNYMKIAPVMQAIERGGLAEQRLVHTGQHYDASMSDAFFDDLGLPAPSTHLGVGSGSHAEQTAKILVAFERVCLEEKPDLVMVAGDVNSTLACALVAAKLNIPSAHIEAGLRSFDMTMPEEVNRILTDRLSRLLFTPSIDADENLRAEGTPAERIFRVGNVMVDTLQAHLERAKALSAPARLGLSPGQYAVLTLHRPSNVDRRDTLGGILEALAALQSEIPIVFPVHPRTRRRIAELGFEDAIAGMSGLRLCEPMGYLEFLGLTSQARLVLTDSGGLQEETTALGIACLTLRESTERPITVSQGTNVVVGSDPERIVAEARRALAGVGKRGQIPELWDGKASERIAAAIDDWWKGRS
jgi:UDP-N-acetylglucosamine 2-epimerase (non-hydrolysing)